MVEGLGIRVRCVDGYSGGARGYVLLSLGLDSFSPTPFEEGDWEAAWDPSSIF